MFPWLAYYTLSLHFSHQAYDLNEKQNVLHTKRVSYANLFPLILTEVTHHANNDIMADYTFKESINLIYLFQSEICRHVVPT